MNEDLQFLKFTGDEEKENFKACAYATDKEDRNKTKAWIDANEAGRGGGKPNRTALINMKKKINDTLGDDEQVCLAAEFDCPDFTAPNDEVAPVLVPAEFLVDGRAAGNRIVPAYMSFGPGTMNGSDGMDSVTDAMRIAGAWSRLSLILPGDNPLLADYDDNFFVSLLVFKHSFPFKPYQDVTGKRISANV
ncbi:hypothetical protein THAOC_01834 [Thalassiosira oceanica]|uniref:Uncharacterized protein n=1 Tax=Thalassiosira oceanica TaxID=159749 RepID=K0TCE3_THAOC|nr:hypothetical protein THAOC_01834 [Thalassiosira oceanica]|eukprot:EJK76403.1 hypothetical protein THAOC_01834 [Thalassiosira oceanica]